jgi:transposase
MAAIYESATRTQAARLGGVTLQIVRDWVMKFNGQGPKGLIDRKPPGQRSRLNDTHRAALAAIIESGPIPAVHGVVRWRIVDLRQWIFEEFRVVVAKQTWSRHALWVIASSRLGLAIMLRPQTRSRIKKAFRASGKDRARKGRRSRRYRGLVRRRGAHRLEEQDHPPLGQARHSYQCSQRSANRFRLHIRRDLPEER